MIYQLRLLLAEMFLNAAMAVIPKDSPECMRLAQTLRGYLNG